MDMGMCDPEDTLLWAQDMRFNVKRTTKANGTVTDRRGVTMDIGMLASSFETHAQLQLQHHEQRENEANMVYNAKVYAEEVRRKSTMKKMFQAVVKEDANFVHNPRAPPPPAPEPEPEPEPPPPPPVKAPPPPPIPRHKLVIPKQAMGFGSSTARVIPAGASKPKAARKPNQSHPTDASGASSSSAPGSSGDAAASTAPAGQLSNSGSSRSTHRCSFMGMEDDDDDDDHEPLRPLQPLQEHEALEVQQQEEEDEEEELAAGRAGSSRDLQQGPVEAAGDASGSGRGQQQHEEELQHHDPAHALEQQQRLMLLHRRLLEEEEEHHQHPQHHQHPLHQQHQQHHQELLPPQQHQQTTATTQQTQQMQPQQQQGGPLSPPQQQRATMMVGSSSHGSLLSQSGPLFGHTQGILTMAPPLRRTGSSNGADGMSLPTSPLSGPPPASPLRPPQLVPVAVSSRSQSPSPLSVTSPPSPLRKSYDMVPTSATGRSQSPLGAPHSPFRKNNALPSLLQSGQGPRSGGLTGTNAVAADSLAPSQSRCVSGPISGQDHGRHKGPVGAHAAHPWRNQSPRGTMSQYEGGDDHGAGSRGHRRTSGDRTSSTSSTDPLMDVPASPIAGRPFSGPIKLTTTELLCGVPISPLPNDLNSLARSSAPTQPVDIMLAAVRAEREWDEAERTSAPLRERVTRSLQTLETGAASSGCSAGVPPLPPSLGRCGSLPRLRGAADPDATAGGRSGHGNNLARGMVLLATRNSRGGSVSGASPRTSMAGGPAGDLGDPGSATELRVEGLPTAVGGGRMPPRMDSSPGHLTHAPAPALLTPSGRLVPLLPPLQAAGSRSMPQVTAGLVPCSRPGVQHLKMWQNTSQQAEGEAVSSSSPQPSPAQPQGKGGEGLMWVARPPVGARPANVVQQQARLLSDLDLTGVRQNSVPTLGTREMQHMLAGGALGAGTEADSDDRSSAGSLRVHDTGLIRPLGASNSVNGAVVAPHVHLHAQTVPCAASSLFSSMRQRGLRAHGAPRGPSKLGDAQGEAGGVALSLQGLRI